MNIARGVVIIEAMSGFAPRFDGVPAVHYLFIDGGCVRAELRALSRRYYGSEDEAQLAWSSFRQNATKVFYYDALPARIEGEDDQAYEERNAAILHLHSMLRRIDGFHVYEGDVRRARSRRERPQQKKVDVMIAVDMLLHTFRKNMNAATLIASDLDFAPLLQALVREGMYITLWHPPSATTEELKAAADARREFSPPELGSSLVTPSGQPLLPQWQNGQMAYRQYPVLVQASALTGSSVILTGDGKAFICEVYSDVGRPVSYAAHHSARVLLMTAEERFSFKLSDDVFQQFGGRINSANH